MADASLKTGGSIVSRQIIDYLDTPPKRYAHRFNKASGSREMVEDAAGDWYKFEEIDLYMFEGGQLMQQSIAELDRLRTALTASEKDAARMQYLEDEAVEVRVNQSALADTGDYSVSIEVIERHMDERKNRVIGCGETWRDAIDAAMEKANG